jgi:hypothetical protein
MRRKLSVFFALVMAILVLGPAHAQDTSASSPPHLMARQKDGTYAPAHLSQDDLARPGMVCIRFNNYWCVKSSGWQGEVSKDARGHARFDDPVSGARAFARLMYVYRYTHRLKTANQIISRYAPSDDCVGSVGKPPNCPYGINPVQEYADRLAKSVDRKATDDLGLFDADKKINMKVAIPLFIAFSSFELTDKYKPDEELITAGIQAAGLQAPE